MNKNIFTSGGLIDYFENNVFSENHEGNKTLTIDKSKHECKEFKELNDNSAKLELNWNIDKCIRKLLDLQTQIILDSDKIRGIQKINDNICIIMDSVNSLLSDN